jgi:acetyl esterase/lipase
MDRGFSPVKRAEGGLDIIGEKGKLSRLSLPIPPGTRMLRAGGSMVLRRRRRPTPDVPARWASAALAVALVAAGQVIAVDEPSVKGLVGERQAATAPGHRSVKRYEIGLGPRSYWLFEPDDPKPERPAPVVVLLHGWFAVNPGFYGAWIDHLVRDGKIVIFPRYQNDVGTLPNDFLANSLAAIRDGVGVLHDGVGHVRPDPARFVLLGHSAGGNLAAQIAAVAADPHADLPVPQLVVALMPGEIVPTREPSLSRILAATRLVVIVGDEDLVVGDLRGRQIYAEATAIPRAHKRFILFRSDRHGYPPLIAEHTAPTGVHDRLDNGEGIFRSLQRSFGDVNALDRAGFWRMTDVLMEAAFDGKTLDDATRDEERFRHLGYWSDGRKVTPPIINADLDAVPRVIARNGLRLFPWSSPPRSGVALDIEKRP